MKFTPILYAGAALAMLFAGCASPSQKADSLAQKGDWTQAVAELRRAAAEAPEDVELRSRLARLELEAAEHHYAKGTVLRQKGFLEGAIAEYRQGLEAMPENEKLAAVVKECEAEREATSLTHEATLLLDAGKLEGARQSLDKALALAPENAEARAAMLKLEEEEGQGAGTLALKSKEPVSLNFKNSEARAAFEFLGKSFGVNMIFDEGIKGSLPRSRPRT